MRKRARLPRREQVFVQSLKYHGFRKNITRKNLKFARGYVIPATQFEDAGGIDFWVKMPRDERILPVQVTQRGIRIRKHYHVAHGEEFANFVQKSNARINEKRKRCKRHGIAFVLVRDFLGHETNSQIAWGDIKALRYAIAHLKRWL